MHDFGFSLIDLFFDPEIANRYVPGTLGSGGSFVEHGHSAEVILIKDKGANVMALSNHEIPQMKPLICGIRETN